MAGVVWVSWYATLFRKDSFAEEVAAIAPLALRYGATEYARPPLSGTTLQDHPDDVVRVQGATGIATGMGPRWSSSAGELGPLPRCRSCTSGMTSSPAGALEPGSHRGTPSTEPQGAPSRLSATLPRSSFVPARRPAARGRARTAARCRPAPDRTARVAAPAGSERSAGGCRAVSRSDRDDPVRPAMPRASCRAARATRRELASGASRSAANSEASVRSPASSNSPARSLALTSPAPSASASAARARAKLSAASGQATVVPRPARTPASDTARCSSPSARAVGIGHQRTGELADRLGDRIGRQRSRTARGLMTLDRHSRDRPRAAPSRHSRRLVNRLDRRSTAALAPAAARAAAERAPPRRRPPSARARAPPPTRPRACRCRRRSTRPADTAWPAPGRRLSASRGGAPPGHSGPDPIGAQQRIEAAAGAHLAPPELAVDVRARHRARGFDLGDQVSQAPAARRRGRRRRNPPPAAARTRAPCRPPR